MVNFQVKPLTVSTPTLLFKVNLLSSFWIKVLANLYTMMKFWKMYIGQSKSSFLSYIDEQFVMGTEGFWLHKQNTMKIPWMECCYHCIQSSARSGAFNFYNCSDINIYKNSTKKCLIKIKNITVVYCSLWHWFLSHFLILVAIVIS